MSSVESLAVTAAWCAEHACEVKEAGSNLRETTSTKHFLLAGKCRDLCGMVLGSIRELRQIDSSRRGVIGRKLKRHWMGVMQLSHRDVRGGLFLVERALLMSSEHCWKATCASWRSTPAQSTCSNSRESCRQEPVFDKDDAVGKQLATCTEDNRPANLSRCLSVACLNAGRLWHRLPRTPKAS